MKYRICEFPRTKQYTRWPYSGTVYTFSNNFPFSSQAHLPKKWGRQLLEGHTCDFVSITAFSLPTPLLAKQWLISLQAWLGTEPQSTLRHMKLCAQHRQRPTSREHWASTRSCLLYPRTRFPPTNYLTTTWTTASAVTKTSFKMCIVYIEV